MHGRPTWVEVFLGISCLIVHFCTKKGIFGIETSITIGFLTFLDVSRFYMLFFDVEPSLT